MKIVNAGDTRRLISIDKNFAFVFSKYGSPPNWSRPQGFVSLSRIILEQQVSLTSANAHFLKLDSYLGEFLPGNILKLSDEEMRNCQVSRQKAKYLRELSGAILKGDLRLEEFQQLEEQEVRKRLTAIKGIGDWTADIYLMFCLQKKDIFPAGDIAVVNTVKELWRVNTREEIEFLAAGWKPLRSLAAYFLWHYYLKKRNRA
jgi:DNA-3-methyladenine glycosylase II